MMNESQTFFFFLKYSRELTNFCFQDGEPTRPLLALREHDNL